MLFPFPNSVNSLTHDTWHLLTLSARYLRNYCRALTLDTAYNAMVPKSEGDAVFQVYLSVFSAESGLSSVDSTSLDFDKFRAGIWVSSVYDFVSDAVNPCVSLAFSLHLLPSIPTCPSVSSLGCHEDGRRGGGGRNSSSNLHSLVVGQSTNHAWSVSIPRHDSNI